MATLTIKGLLFEVEAKLFRKKLEEYQSHRETSVPVRLVCEGPRSHSTRITITDIGDLQHKEAESFVGSVNEAFNKAYGRKAEIVVHR